MKHYRFLNKMTLIPVTLMILLIGCTQRTEAEPADTQPPPTPIEITVVDNSQPSETQPAATNVKAQPSDTTPPEAANTEAPEVVQPTPHQDLHASNPDEFELASGRVQLVELFAYW